MALTLNSKIWKIMLVVTLVLTAIFGILFYFKDIFVILLVGGVLILITENIIDFVNRKIFTKKIKLWEKTFIWSFLLLILFFGLVLVVSTQLNQLTSVINNAPSQDHLKNLIQYAEPYLPDSFSQEVLKISDLKIIQDYIVSSATTILSRISFFLLAGILVTSLLFKTYFKDREYIENSLKKLVPIKYRKGYVKAINEIKTQLKSFFSAKLLESSIITTICAIGFFIIGLDGWVLLALIVGILNIIPYIGPILGGIPAVVIGFLISPLTAIYALGIILIAQAVDNFYIIPFMIPGKVKVNSLVAILLTIMLAQLFGALGMVVAIPIYIVYRVVLKVMYFELIKLNGKKKMRKRK